MLSTMPPLPPLPTHSLEVSQPRQSIATRTSAPSPLRRPSRRRCFPRISPPTLLYLTTRSSSFNISSSSSHFLHHRSFRRIQTKAAVIQISITAASQRTPPPLHSPLLVNRSQHRCSSNSSSHSHCPIWALWQPPSSSSMQPISSFISISHSTVAVIITSS